LWLIFYLGVVAWLAVLGAFVVVRALAGWLL